MGAFAVRFQQSDPPLTGFQFAARIINPGDSGILTDWRIEAKLKDGRTLIGGPSPLPSGVTGNRAVLPSHWVDLSINNIEVKTGEIKEGQIYFSFNVSSPEIDNPATIFVLSAMDIYEKRYFAEQRLSDWSMQK